MIAGAGGNIGVQIGSDGVVLVDSGRAGASDQVVAAVRKLTDKPIRYIINTNADADHVGGNAQVAKAGKTFFDVSGPRAELAKSMTNGGAAAILAPDTVLNRMSESVGKGSAFPSEGWPTEAFFESRKTIYLNHEGIEILRQPAAHSDSDSFVFFRSSDVVMAGDVLDTTQFPRIDLARGGSIHGEIEALNQLIQIAIPSVPLVNQEGGTYVISGHGRICDQSDVVDYRDMVVVVRDVIQDMIKRGMTLAQIKSASPAMPYETQYGSTSGAWTTNAFVEAVYNSLMVKK
jgi:glyoxylase-like metal-dependent hydrolase (beta-lactamase superfamily II)